MRIGILQTGHALDEIRQTLGDYDAMFARLLDGHGFEFRTFNIVDGEFPGGIEVADGWLITGSRHGAYEDHPWIAPLEALIREIHAAGKPLVGICFGHQIIAQALGGRVEKFAGGWNAGATDYRIEGEQLCLNAWHQDQVVALPPDARIIGESGLCRYAALTYGDTVLTYQPHPEFDDYVMETIMEGRGRGLVPDPLLDAAVARLGTPTASARIADRIAGLFRQGRLS